MRDHGDLQADLADSFRAAIQMGCGLIRNLKDVQFVAYETRSADEAVKQMCDGPIYKIQSAVRTARKLLAFLPRNVPPQAAEPQTKARDAGRPSLPTGDTNPSIPTLNMEEMVHGASGDGIPVEGTPDPKKDRFREELHHFLTELSKAYQAIQEPSPTAPSVQRATSAPASPSGAALNMPYAINPHAVVTPYTPTPEPPQDDPAALAANQPISIEHLTALCTRIVLELQDVQKRLQAAIRKRSKWDLIAEGEEARYRTITGLYAGLSLAMRLLDPSGKQSTVVLPEWNSELETAQIARDVLLSLAQVLLPLSTDADHAPYQHIPPCLRTIRWQLDHVVEQPSYASLRAHDRHQLQTLRASLAAWLDAPVRDETEARSLLATAHAFASRVAAINNRSLLVAHDRALQQKAISQLNVLTHQRRRLFQRAPDMHAPLAELLEELRPLRWREQQLHTFLEEADALQHRSNKELKHTMAQLDTVLRAIRL